MPTCKCRDCKECSTVRKSRIAEEPQESRSKQGSNHSAYPKSRKQLEDVLKQAEKELWWHIDWLEDAKARSYKSWSISWHIETIARISREIMYVRAYIRQLGR